MSGNKKIFRTKTDKLLEGWLVATVAILIFGSATLMMGFLIYPHVAGNPSLAEKIGWTPEEIQEAKEKSEIFISIGIWSIFIFFASIVSFLVTAWLLGYLSP